MVNRKMNHDSEVDRVNEDHFRRKLEKRIEQYPNTPILDHFPDDLLSRSKWNQLDRKVLSGQKPKAIVAWQREAYDWMHSQNLQTGEEKWTVEKQLVLTPVNVFSIEQTKEIRKHPRTKAIEMFWDIFCELSNEDFKIPYLEDGPKTWRGKLTLDELKQHIRGIRDVAIRMSGKTRFIGIDHDLHNGSRNIFVRQLDILLDEFWGRHTWNIQVADEDAGGVHFFYIFKQPEGTADVVGKLKDILRQLDEKHPELAAAAIRCGMKTFSQMEVKPSETVGLRLPCAAGRTMLVDRPLAKVTHRGKQESDIVAYMKWISDAIAGNAKHMARAEVYEFIVSRLSSITQHTTGTPIVVPIEMESGASEQPEQVKLPASNFKGMKNTTWKKLVEAWSGNMEPDSLNHWIRQLSLYTPFQFSTQEEAVELIENFIDELPNHDFSDRLSSGERYKVSNVVKYDVKVAFEGWLDQPNPKKSARKLKAVWAKWTSTGRSPFDKSTWKNAGGATSYRDVKLSEDFVWTEEEIRQLDPLARLLRAELPQTCRAVSVFVRLIKVHPEVPWNWIVQLLDDQGIPARSKNVNKPKLMVDHLESLDWVYIPVGHNKGRCRRFGLNKLRTKFPVNQEQDKSDPPVYIDMAKWHQRYDAVKHTLFNSTY